MGLLCMAMREYLGKGEDPVFLLLRYPRCGRVPNALYNCVQFRAYGAAKAQTRLADFVSDVDGHQADLQPESKRHRMADQMGWVYKVDQQKGTPLRIKQRVFQMGEYIGGTISDFWLKLFWAIRSCPPPRSWHSTPRIFGVVPPDGASVGVEAASLNGKKIILCIHNKAPNPVYS